MNSYTKFAFVYDELMDNIPYDDWCEYLVSLLKEYGVEKGLIAELGCGTGAITQRLAARGYDMIGIDNAQEMLILAREKQTEREEASNILYLLQDMREFELFGTVDAIVSVCDSLNYITEEMDLFRVFRLVNNYLEEKGLFIFDLNTEYKYQEILKDRTIAESREDVSFIWENEYNAVTKLNEYDLTLFVKEDGEENLFRKWEETHIQRAYSLEKVKELLERAGMEFIACYDAFTRRKPTEKSERIYIIAREGKQEGKLYLKKEYSF